MSKPSGFMRCSLAPVQAQGPGYRPGIVRDLRFNEYDIDHPAALQLVTYVCIITHNFGPETFYYLVYDFTIPIMP